MTDRVNAPYRSLLSEVCGELGIAPGCATPEGIETFSLPETKPNNINKARYCAECLVRLECLTDGINGMLKTGTKPIMSTVSIFQGGMSSSRLLEIGRDYYARGITGISIDEAETLEP